MALPNRFFDSEGNEVSLEKLCRIEPGWAANRIRHMQAEIDCAVKILSKMSELLSSHYPLVIEGKTATEILALNPASHMSFKSLKAMIERCWTDSGGE